ncbi:hypothetical protein [Enteroccous phage Ef212]|nr:hypothetical protein [Enteroccous phage Ef212]
MVVSQSFLIPPICLLLSYVPTIPCDIVVVNTFV